MSSPTVDSSALRHLLDDAGLHFLLTPTRSVLGLNGKPLPKSALVHQLHERLGGRSLVCAFQDTDAAVRTLAQLLTTTTSKVILPGIRWVRPEPGNKVHIRGGSYSQTFLYLRDERWRFVKQCPRYNHTDKDERLVAEMEFIAQLPRPAQPLFPKILEARKDKQVVRYEMDYIPYPDFAEVVRSGQYPAAQLSQLLHSMYDRLFELLYLPIPNTPDQPSSYAATIRRRMQETLAALPTKSYLRPLLAADSIRINGVKFDGLERSLQLADDFLQSYPLPATYNHGDLILQDILIHPDTGDFRLVDGNGNSISYMNDFAKMLLCLETKYDLFYDGDFELRADVSKLDSPLVDFTFTDLEYLRVLDEMRDKFLGYLENHQGQFFRTVQDWRKVLMLLCGLQNIAIVMFHVLHHEKPERACGFLVCGIKLINDTIKGKGRGDL